MKLCVFQGTFNPIHKVHLEVAKFAKEYYGFDSILFIPAYLPPHKHPDKSLAKHRFNMVKLAVSRYKFFNVSDIEYRSEKISYTYNTIKELYKRYDVDGKINFIIGTDAFEHIKSWYEADKLKDLVHFIVFKRTNHFNEYDFDELRKEGYDFEFSPMNFIDVSSTKLRENIHNKNSIKDMEIQPIREYIEKNGLYR